MEGMAQPGSGKSVLRRTGRHHFAHHVRQPGGEGIDSREFLEALGEFVKAQIDYQEGGSLAGNESADFLSTPGPFAPPAESGRSSVEVSSG
jgi:hypothetical protein